jgi:O-antigen/teichoic acid export membrane protein
MPRPSDSLVRQLALTIVRHTSAYVVARAAVVGLGVVQLLVLTRFLVPSALGEFSIVTLIASFVGLACQLVFRRGTLGRTFGRIVGDDDDGGDDGDGADGDDDADDDRDSDRGRPNRRRPPGASRDPRAAFATGFILMTVVGGAMVALVVPLSSDLSSLLNLPAQTGPGWVVLGAASGVLLAQWQTLLAVPRLLRRPGAYLVMSLVRALLVFGLTLGVVIAFGGGASEAVLGQAMGLAGAVVVGLTAFRGVYRPVFSAREVAPILALSFRRIPRQLGKWVIHIAPSLVLASAAAPATVGYYRVASRLTLPLTFPTVAFFQAWMPMQRSPIVLAAEQEEGRQKVRAMATTLLTVVVTGVLVVLLVTMDLLHHLLPADYAGAITLVPWLLALAIADIVHHTARRFGRYRHRARIYIWTLLITAAMTIPLAILLVGAMGAQGAALTGIIAWSVLAGVQWCCSQFGAAPIPLEYGRLAATIALGAACLGVAFGGRALWPRLGIALDLAAIALYPIGLVGLQILPEYCREAFRGFRARSAEPGVDETVHMTIDHLEANHRRALEATLARSDDNGAPVSDESTQLSALAALRRCSGTRTRPASVERAIARYLFSTRDSFARNHAVGELYGSRVAPREIVLLERWRDQARKAIHG